MKQIKKGTTANELIASITDRRSRPTPLEPQYEDIEPLTNKSIKIFQRPNVTGGMLFQIYLTGDIGDAQLYTDAIQLIRMAQPEDIVFIYINSVGGLVFTGLQIINAMRESQAEIVTVLDSMAYSMGAAIFLSGTSKIVHEFGSLMIHNYSSGSYGKGHELRQHINALDACISEYSHQIFEGFLTDDELSDVLKGQDLYLTASQVSERLELSDLKETLEHESDNLLAMIEQYNELHDGISNQITELEQFANDNTLPLTPETTLLITALRTINMNKLPLDVEPSVEVITATDVTTPSKPSRRKPSKNHE
jgi:ATP-dependent Clp protease protease subunit